MNRTLVLVAGIGLAIGTVAFAMPAAADHGPFCQTQACCEEHEPPGPQRNACNGCVLLGTNAWDTHANQCILE